MTSVTLFDELCRIAATLESLTTSKCDPAVMIALKAIVIDFDQVIDQGVEGELLATEAATA